MSRGQVVIAPRNGTKIIGILQSLALKSFGVYICFYDKHQKLIPWFKKNGLNFNNFFLIDPIAKATEFENVFVVPSAKDLTEIFIVLTEALEEPDVKFIVLDTVEDLAFYNGFDRARKFLTALVRHVKERERILIFLSRKAKTIEESKATHLARSLADKVVI